MDYIYKQNDDIEFWYEILYIIGYKILEIADVLKEDYDEMYIIFLGFWVLYNINKKYSVKICKL